MIAEVVLVVGLVEVGHQDGLERVGPDDQLRRISLQSPSLYMSLSELSPSNSSVSVLPVKPEARVRGSAPRHMVRIEWRESPSLIFHNDSTVSTFHGKIDVEYKSILALRALATLKNWKIIKGGLQRLVRVEERADRYRAL